MIRFIPDSWWEALLRFFAMAAPDGNVYVEIPAPDLRFAAIVLLALAVALCWGRVVANRRPAVALLAFVLAATVPWLLTSGNGRYWIPVLLAAGPLAVGLAYLLPLTKAFKLFLAAGLLAAQTFVVLQVSPWDSWTWVAWSKAPYFQVETPPVDGSEETTYVTLSSISYSLIAPQFPASSRWINLTSVGGTVRDRTWAQEFLAAARGPLKLIAPSIPGQVGADGEPRADVKKALDVLLASQRLALAPQGRCQLLRSRGLSLEGPARNASDAGSRDIGFWLCPLRYPAEPAPEKTLPLDPRAEAGFARIEQSCPRFFAPGSSTVRINGGALRHYPGSDMKAYVLDDGNVMYKFWRALNPVLVGRLDDVLSGKAAIDCDHIRGRAGLPWEREI
jgi:hypothetical protein